MSKQAPIPYIVRGETINLIINGTPYVVAKTDKHYKKVLKSIKDQDWTEVAKLVDIKNAFTEFANGKVKVKGSKFEYNGQVIHNSLTRRIVQMYHEGFPVDPMVNFLINLMGNPSYTAVNDLYEFLEKNNLPITEDGCFVAYKRIKEDYTDVYTGKIDNSIGNVVSMPRNEVNDDHNRTCAAGLHVCSREYLSHYSGNKIVVVKVNPKDVVAVPKDYNFSKMRVCEYKVESELSIEEAFEDILSKSSVR